MSLADVREAKYLKARKDVITYNKSTCAKVAGVGYHKYLEFERNPREMTQIQAEKLAKHFGVSTNDLFFD